MGQNQIALSVTIINVTSFNNFLLNYHFEDLKVGLHTFSLFITCGPNFKLTRYQLYYPIVNSLFVYNLNSKKLEILQIHYRITFSSHIFHACKIYQDQRSIAISLIKYLNFKYLKSKIMH